MPIYEYQCNGCGKLYELLKPIEERDRVLSCTTQWCSGQTERIASMFNVVRELSSSGSDSGR